MPTHALLYQLPGNDIIDLVTLLNHRNDVHISMVEGTIDTFAVMTPMATTTENTIKYISGILDQAQPGWKHRAELLAPEDG